MSGNGPRTPRAPIPQKRRTTFVSTRRNPPPHPLAWSRRPNHRISSPVATVAENHTPYTFYQPVVGTRIVKHTHTHTHLAKRNTIHSGRVKRSPRGISAGQRFGLRRGRVSESVFVEGLPRSASKGVYMYIYIYICSSVVCGVSSQLISYSPCTRVVVSDNDTTTTDTRVGDVISSAYVCVCVCVIRSCAQSIPD